MGQAEVIDILEKIGEPLSRTEIASLLGENPVKISECIRKLIHNGDVDCIEIGRKEARKKYNSKRRLRIYKIKQ